MPGASAKASRSRRREDDCLRAELKREFYLLCQHSIAFRMEALRTMLTGQKRIAIRNTFRTICRLARNEASNGSTRRQSEPPCRQWLVQMFLSLELLDERLSGCWISSRVQIQPSSPFLEREVEREERASRRCLMQCFDLLDHLRAGACNILRALVPGLKMLGLCVIQLTSQNSDEYPPHSLPAMNCHTSYDSCLFPSPNILHESISMTV